MVSNQAQLVTQIVAKRVETQFRAAELCLDTFHRSNSMLPVTSASLQDRAIAKQDHFPIYFSPLTPSLHNSLLYYQTREITESSFSHVLRIRTLVSFLFVQSHLFCI